MVEQAQVQQQLSSLMQKRAFHAPVNEQGVVFLFGLIARELGYVVEIVRSGFPDCEAKRQIKGRAGKWERVRIEFEFESRTFRSHGHDPDQCDVIVCRREYAGPSVSHV